MAYYSIHRKLTIVELLANIMFKSIFALSRRAGGSVRPDYALLVWLQRNPNLTGLLSRWIEALSMILN